MLHVLDLIWTLADSRLDDLHLPRLLARACLCQDWTPCFERKSPETRCRGHPHPCFSEGDASCCYGRTKLSCLQLYRHTSRTRTSGQPLPVGRRNGSSQLTEEARYGGDRDVFKKIYFTISTERKRNLLKNISELSKNP